MLSYFFHPKINDKNSYLDSAVSALRISDFNRYKCFSHGFAPHFTWLKSVKKLEKTPRHVDSYLLNVWNSVSKKVYPSERQASYRQTSMLYFCTAAANAFYKVKLRKDQPIQLQLKRPFSLHNTYKSNQSNFKLFILSITGTSFTGSIFMSTYRCDSFILSGTVK